MTEVDAAHGSRVFIQGEMRPDFVVVGAIRLRMRRR